MKSKQVLDLVAQVIREHPNQEGLAKAHEFLGTAKTLLKHFIRMEGGQVKHAAQDVFRRVKDHCSNIGHRLELMKGLLRNFTTRNTSRAINDLRILESYGEHLLQYIASGGLERDFKLSFLGNLTDRLKKILDQSQIALQFIDNTWDKKGTFPPIVIRRIGWVENKLKEVIRYAGGHCEHKKNVLKSTTHHPPKLKEVVASLSEGDQEEFEVRIRIYEQALSNACEAPKLRDVDLWVTKAKQALAVINRLLAQAGSTERL